MLNRALKALLVTAAFLAAAPGVAQEKINLSIATGGTGGVYYPLGGGMAARAIATQRVDRLRGQPDMAHHGHAAPCEEGDRLGHLLVVFDHQHPHGPTP